MLFNQYFHKTNALAESLDALDQVSKMHSLQEFLGQQKSPYILLQILAIALVNLPGMPTLTLDQINADPKLLVGDVIRQKMHYLMTKTRFSNDFNTAFRTIFPDSVANPIEWAKKNREQVTNLNSPEIKNVLASVVQKYSEA